MWCIFFLPGHWITFILFIFDGCLWEIFSSKCLWNFNRKTDGEREYLVKWKDLPYDECYWELGSDISAFQLQIERFNQFQSRAHKSSVKKKSFDCDVKDSKTKQKEFQQYEHSPGFLSGGMVGFLFFILFFMRLEDCWQEITPNSFIVLSEILLWYLFISPSHPLYKLTFLFPLCSRDITSLSAWRAELFKICLVKAYTCDSCRWNGSW